MGVKPILIDMKTEGQAFLDYLKKRNTKTMDHVQEQIETNSFLLVNKFDDIWFWELNLINYFFGDLLE